MIKITRVSRKIMAVLGVCLIASSIPVLASITYSPYSLKVAPFNTSEWTESQVKANPWQGADIKSTSVGGGYKVDARMIGSGAYGPWTRGIVSGKQYSATAISDKHVVGTKTQLEFSNGLTTPVQVAISGTWRSN